MPGKTADRWLCLTGGTEKGIESEQVLKKINEEWDRGERTPGDFLGIEAFIEVLVRPQEADAAEDAGPAATEPEAPAVSLPKPPAPMKLSDERVVAHWDRCLPESIGIENPRLLRP